MAWWYYDALDRPVLKKGCWDLSNCSGDFVRNNCRHPILTGMKLSLDMLANSQYRFYRNKIRFYQFKWINYIFLLRRFTGHGCASTMITQCYVLFEPLMGPSPRWFGYFGLFTRIKWQTQPRSTTRDKSQAGRRWVYYRYLYL